MPWNRTRHSLNRPGATFIAVKDGCVSFSDDGSGDAVISLYCFACTPENIHLSLKNAREPVVGFEPLETTE
jgi:hypothetical protein